MPAQDSEKVIIDYVRTRIVSATPARDGRGVNVTLAYKWKGTDYQEDQTLREGQLALLCGSKKSYTAEDVSDKSPLATIEAAWDETKKAYRPKIKQLLCAED